MTNPTRNLLVQTDLNGYKRYTNTPSDQGRYPCNACNAPHGVPQGVPVKLMYRVEETVELLSISRSRIFELLRSGRLRSVTHGRSRLIPHSALLEFIEDLETSA